MTKSSKKPRRPTKAEALTPDAKSLALDRAISAIEIVNISVAALEAGMRNGYSPNFILPQHRRVQLRGPVIRALEFTDEEHAKAGNPMLFQFKVQCGLRLIDIEDTQDIPLEDAEKKTILQVEAEFFVCYRLKDGAAFPDEEAMREFGENNVTFNVWPYWRELIQSVTTRLGVASVTIPLRRMLPLKPHTPNKT